MRLRKVFKRHIELPLTWGKDWEEGNGRARVVFWVRCPDLGIEARNYDEEGALSEMKEKLKTLLPCDVKGMIGMPDGRFQVRSSKSPT